jgi:hypothetical protein
MRPALVTLKSRSQLLLGGKNLKDYFLLYFYLNKIHIMDINAITRNQLSPLHN